MRCHKVPRCGSSQVFAALGITSQDVVNQSSGFDLVPDLEKVVVDGDPDVFVAEEERQNVRHMGGGGEQHGAQVATPVGTPVDPPEGLER